MLSEFIVRHREAILAQARARVLERSAPLATEAELALGLPPFLDQITEALRRTSSGEAVNQSELDESASQHGRDLFHRGLSIGQVVHDYGDLCQVITALAVKEGEEIPATDFKTLNLCLDDGIAGAVTEFSRRREQALTAEGTERLGILAHEMRNLLNTALMSFGSIKRGVVAPGGSTSAIHERSLLRLHALIDSSLADVRLEAGMKNLERVALRDVVEEVEIGASLLAQTRGLKFAVTPVDATVFVEADRQILAAAMTNLLQNAFKFTRPDTTVTLRTTTTDTRVLIDTEDECGGLPPGEVEALLRPFTQRSRDRTGLGLGLSICLKAVESLGGALRIRDLPGKGCVFTIDLPKQPPPPEALKPRKPKLRSVPPVTGGAQGAGLSRSQTERGGRGRTASSS